MLLRMTTQSAGRATTAPRGGRTGGRTGRGGGRTRGRFDDVGNGGIDGQGGQVVGQGIKVNDGADGVPDLSTIIVQQLQNLRPTISAQGNVRKVIENNDRRGCTYKEFLACNPKEYDGKGGAMVYTRWIEKMKSVQDMSGCKDNQKGRLKTLTREEFFSSNEMQKLETGLWNHAMVEAGHATYTNRFYKLDRLVPYLVTLENKTIKRYAYDLVPQIRGMVAATKTTTIQEAVQIAGTLTDEAIRNGSIKKSHKKRGNVGEPSKDMNERDDNKRTRTGNSFATTTNPIRRENTCMAPKCTTCYFYHPLKAPCCTCFNCNRSGHLAKDCRVVPRNVNPINTRNPTAAGGACFECEGIDNYKSTCLRLNRPQGLGVNRINQALAIDGGQGHGNNGN
nr:hypothetical protein [Tanacetum cinerariifolium]